MNLRHLALSAALVLAAAVPVAAWSAECDADLATADTAIAAGPRENVTAEAFEQAKTLRTEAGRLLAAGDDAACVQSVGKAFELLGIAVGSD